jgi:hypothetical protein
VLKLQVVATTPAPSFLLPLNCEWKDKCINCTVGKIMYMELLRFWDLGRDPWVHTSSWQYKKENTPILKRVKVKEPPEPFLC